MKQTMIVSVLVLMWSAALPAQALKPSAEHKKLGMFLGSWSVDGQIKAGNGYGVPAGKFITVERYQWLPGDFFG